MKRRVIVTSCLAMSLSMATGLTSYAGWVQESNGWAYVYDDGHRAPCGWFTDPETGAEYHLDPDGYMMTETRVDGFWLEADGRKRAKTQAEIEAEENKKKREASKPSPAKAQAAIKAAAAEAKETNVAVSTIRSHYVGEMQALMDKIYIGMAEKLYADKEERQKARLEEAKQKALAEAEQKALELGGDVEIEDLVDLDKVKADYSDLYPTVANTINNNQETEYSFVRISDKQNIISTKYSKILIKKSIYYIDHALEISYNRGLANSDEERAVFDEGYRQLLVAALGGNEGAALCDRILAGAVETEASGVTDTGNTYVVKNMDGLVTIQVTCSEKTESTDGTENADEGQSESSVENDSQASTATVIVAGQPKNSESEDTENKAAETEAGQENENNEEAAE